MVNQFVKRTRNLHPKLRKRCVVLTNIYKNKTNTRFLYPIFKTFLAFLKIHRTMHFFYDHIVSKGRFLLLLLLCLAATECSRERYTNTAPPFVPDYALDRYEAVIRKYESRDSLQAPAPDFVAFGGSSSIYFWETLQQDMAPTGTLNYGFGGSTFPEVFYYAERTLLRHNPKTIVLYCENDLFGDRPKTPAQVLDDYVRLVQKIRQKLPKTQLFFISLKPSPARWRRWSESVETNRLIAEFIKKDKRHAYIDITEAMLKNGRPDPLIFKSDSLHMNAEGYRRWTAVVRRALTR
jgi:lysophospholipase L1-like esterase